MCTLELAHQGGEENLLVGDTTKVTTVTNTVTGAQELQCLETREGVHSCIEECLGVFVLDGLGHTDFNTTDGICHLNHTVELNHGGKRNAQAGEFFDGENYTGQAALIQGSVDRTRPAATTVGAIRVVHNHVTGNGNHGCIGVVR